MICFDWTKKPTSLSLLIYQLAKFLCYLSVSFDLSARYILCYPTPLAEYWVRSNTKIAIKPIEFCPELGRLIDIIWQFDWLCNNQVLRLTFPGNVNQTEPKIRSMLLYAIATTYWVSFAIVNYYNHSGQEAYVPYYGNTIIIPENA